MNKSIFHGSKNKIEQPIYGYGKPYNDYGLGFYCTEEIDLAKEWAVDFKQNGYANHYELDMTGLNVLYLNESPYCTLHWLALLLANRTFDASVGLPRAAKEYLLENFLLDISAYDVIIGYRADDSCFAFAQDFIAGTVSYRQLNNAMHLGELGEQIVLKTERGFSALRFVDAEYVSADEWYVKKASRDELARKTYFSLERNGYQKGDLYITQILNEEMKPDDPRL